MSPQTDALAEEIRAELARLRGELAVPVELRLDSERWRTLAPLLESAPFGGRRAVVFEGVKCVLTVGIRDPRGFRIRALAAPES